jgi:alkanesulfonate monooxygenase SsuD/methylene tetrahydromethanopterin reductase-like flavin-dependent oxidoreductase (luciferase family)
VPAAELFSAGYWLDQVTEAERGQLDFVTLEDAVGLQSSIPGDSDRRTDQVRGRLDAVLLASRLAPATSRIGLVPTASTNQLEPFHLSTAIATLDYVSSGRAGWRPQITGAFASSRRTDEATVFERSALFDEAADVAEVVRRLWDSWEDDAVIRDAATDRFLDRSKLHYIDFEGSRFSVKGPSITPRPPQGQPVVAALAHVPVAYRFAARAADVVFITPHDTDQVASIVTEVRAAEQAVERTGPSLREFADLVVFLDDQAGVAADRKRRLDELDGAPLASDAAIVTGTPTQVADQLIAWQREGLDGFRLRPAELPHDLTAITRGLVPHLQARSAFRRQYGASTLRGHLGLPRPANRYATSA